MRIGLQTWGSEGDVHPFLALGAGLVRAGHSVTLVVSDPTHRDYSEAARKAGITLVPIPGAPVLQDEFLALSRDVLATRNPLRQMKKILEYWYFPLVPEMFEAAKQLCATSDLVVGHMILHPLRVAAEQAGVPVATVCLAPGGTPSAFLRPPGVPDLGNWLNPWWWKLGAFLLNRSLLPAFNALRLREGLMPHRDLLTEAWASPWLHLHAISQALCPRPEDWGPQHEVCGFFAAPPETGAEAIPPALARFLEAGPPPVYFSFGSMLPATWEALHETEEIWRAAVKRVGCRAIFQLPWDAPDAFEQDPRIFTVQRSAHAAVFPRCALVVHHGGAGTTQTALRAGRPAVVVPHLGDQFFWAAELERRGVAGRPRPRLRLTADGLARSIAQVLNTRSMTRKAEQLGAAMAQVQGVEAAVHLLENAYGKLRKAGSR